jgi:hypothetical protein
MGQTVLQVNNAVLYQCHFPQYLVNLGGSHETWIFLLQGFSSQNANVLVIFLNCRDLGDNHGKPTLHFDQGCIFSQGL